MNKLKKQETVVQGEEDQEEVEELTPEEMEEVRLINLDFWLGKMMSKYPHFFYDLEHKKASKKFFIKCKCKNCMQNIISENQRKSENLWYSQKLKGFFCKNCIHPVDTDLPSLLFQLRQSKFAVPQFKSDDRKKKDAIMIDKERNPNHRSFCYKNQITNVKRQLLPEKW
jgi:hypothetical protein